MSAQYEAGYRNAVLDGLLGLTLSYPLRVDGEYGRGYRQARADAERRDYERSRERVAQHENGTIGK